jgi:hypothetical protein
MTKSQAEESGDDVSQRVRLLQVAKIAERECRKARKSQQAGIVVCGYCRQQSLQVAGSVVWVYHNKVSR